MTGDLTESAAKVIYEACAKRLNVSSPWRSVGEMERETYRVMARSAIRLVLTEPPSEATTERAYAAAGSGMELTPQDLLDFAASMSQARIKEEGL